MVRWIGSVLMLVGMMFPFIFRPAELSGQTYYVSLSGDNSDGLSLRTAWSELDQIHWAVIQPGDTILISAGTYRSTLVVGKDGAAGQPITILAAGRVVIFGGRTVPLPECHTPVANYTFQTAGVRDAGVHFKGHQWIVLEGGTWRGITITGHNKTGIAMGEGAANDTIRNVEVYDNGKAYQTTGGEVPSPVWNPDLPGVNLTGTNITFERAIIHDNGQDAFQSGGGVSNFTLRDSWLYNGRYHSTQTHPGEYGPEGESFNYCRHSDGIQIYGGGTQSGIVIEGSVLGPNVMHGALLGSWGSATIGTVNDVTVRNTLVYATTNIGIAGGDLNDSRHWTLDHVTIVRPAMPHTTGNCLPGEQNFNLFARGGGHSISNSIIVGGCMVEMPADTVATHNLEWGLDYGLVVGGIADPRFVRPDGEPLTRDFALQPGSPAAGLGSPITSVARLLASSLPPTQPPVLATTTPIAATQAPILPTRTPAWRPTPAATSAITPTAIAQVGVNQGSWPLSLAVWSTGLLGVATLAIVLVYVFRRR